MATSERKIETPFGPRVGNIFDRLELLGVASFLTQSGNQSNAQLVYDETKVIDVPVGTMVVVPSPNLWVLGYGGLQPEFVDPLNDNQSVSWGSEDHNWGMGWFQISVVDVNAVDTTQSPPKQTAQLRISMILRDDNGDDSWFGVAGYTLLFLGRAPKIQQPASPTPRGRRELMESIRMR